MGGINQTDTNWEVEVESLKDKIQEKLKLKKVYDVAEMMFTPGRRGWQQKFLVIILWNAFVWQAR